MKPFEPVYVGETVTTWIDLANADGSAPNLAALFTGAEYELRRRPRNGSNPTEEVDNPIILTKSVASGTITLVGARANLLWVPADTGALEPKTYHADLFLLAAGGVRRLANVGPQSIGATVNAP